jgi:hypothetical protein
MTSLSNFVAASVLDAYDLGRFGTAVDVGGGRGAMLVAILAREAELRGVLFDQPHVVASAPQHCSRLESIREAGSWAAISSKAFLTTVKRTCSRPCFRWSDGCLPWWQVLDSNQRRR